MVLTAKQRESKRGKKSSVSSEGKDVAAVLIERVENRNRCLGPSSTSPNKRLVFLRRVFAMRNFLEQRLSTNHRFDDRFSGPFPDCQSLLSLLRSHPRRWSISPLISCQRTEACQNRQVTCHVPPAASRLQGFPLLYVGIMIHDHGALHKTGKPGSTLQFHIATSTSISLL